MQIPESIQKFLNSCNPFQIPLSLISENTKSIFPLARGNEFTAKMRAFVCFVIG
jgi:hypothetical protein